jgi:IclR family acetate operon transcriptional repressor
VRCVAASIFNHDDVMVAALGVSSLSSRISPAKAAPMAAVVGLRIPLKLGSHRAILH